MLIVLFILPLIGTFLIAPINRNNVSTIKQISLIIRVITFIYSMNLWLQFDSNRSQFQFTGIFNDNQFGHFHIGIDGISLYYILLTTFTMPICILASWSDDQKSHKYYMICFLIVERLLIAVFMVKDLLLFYVFFESVLIPLFMLVGIWGARESRVRASYLLFLYTLLGSLFMLLAFLVIIYQVGTSDLDMLSLIDIQFDSQKLLWLAIFLRFAIKTPIFPFHLWLIRAHVEAPVGVSMILAGLVLKLASYGMLRILLPILPEASSYYSPLALTLAIISIVYGSLSCLRQTDFKCLIAYSRIAHMGIVILGIFSNTIQGIEGSILLSIGHGFVSPALFYIVGGILYDRYHTRVIRYYRGLRLYMPLTMIFFFMFTSANMGLPSTINWTGELLALTGIFQRNILICIIASIRIVLRACYSIWLYNRLSFGSWSQYLNYTKDLSRREFVILISLLIPTIILGLVPNIILTDIHYSVSSLIYSIK